MRGVVLHVERAVVSPCTSTWFSSLRVSKLLPLFLLTLRPPSLFSLCFICPPEVCHLVLQWQGVVVFPAVAVLAQILPCSAGARGVQNLAVDTWLRKSHLHPARIDV